MKFVKVQFNGDPNIGLYGFSTDSYCLLGNKPRQKERIESLLGTEIRTTTIAGTELAGIFAAGNSFGIVLPKIAEREEIKSIKALGINTLILKSRETALGNMVLCNDKGCIISEKLKLFRKEIADCLSCEVETGRIAGMSIVGSCAIATNKGCLCHRNMTRKEADEIEGVLNVKADVGSISGSPFVKSGIIANSLGAIVSEKATGPELERILEVFE